MKKWFIFSLVVSILVFCGAAFAAISPAVPANVIYKVKFVQISSSDAAKRDPIVSGTYNIVKLVNNLYTVAKTVDLSTGVNGVVTVTVPVGTKLVGGTNTVGYRHGQLYWFWPATFKAYYPSNYITVVDTLGRITTLIPSP
jgi:hypothetical protein